MDRESLIAAGFKPTTYDGQPGEYLAKRMKVERMPYASEHLVDNDYIYGSSEAVVEVCPDGRVQFMIGDADYTEGPVPADSEEGIALLKDAIDAR